MVPKSKILGKPSLIFITLGTTKYPFNRLNSYLGELLNSIQSASKIIFQGETSKYYKHKNILYKKTISPEKFIEILKKSTHIITHAGPGNLYFISKYASIFPFIIARSDKFGEHISNHQEHYLNYIKTKLPRTHHKYVIDDENFEKMVDLYLRSQPEKNTLTKYLFLKNDKQNILNNISDYITNIDKTK